MTSKIQIPGVFWVAIILLLPPAIIPIIQQFFPANTYWWSAGIIVVLNVIVISIRIAWPKEAGEVPTGAAADAQLTAAPKERGVASKLFFGA